MMSGNRGVILIALLWILTALSVLALSFSRESFVEVAVARNTRDLSDAYYIARAGMIATIYQLVQKRFSPPVKQLALPAPPDPIDLGRVTGRFADGIYDVEIQDESGKINLNFVLEDQLRALIEFIGISKPDSDIITDSILDWKDVDPAHRLNGAEDDYYQSLNPPYKAKNGRMDTVEELLLVRGVTRDYFYGHAEKTDEGAIIYKYGLSRYFTVYSSRNQININYAPLPVLMSVPGMTQLVAESIIERRKTKPFESITQDAQGLAGTISPQSMPLLTAEQTGIYSLTASAHREGSKVQRLIRAVVALNPTELTRYRIVYWNENVPNL